MTAAPALDQRSRQVLLSVIAEYVETGEPVGSRAIARRNIAGPPPATIRNAMADLEEMGYLVQPHTSAGRVPTDAAYRFYVDHLQRGPWGAGPGPPGGPPAGAPPPAGAAVLGHAHDGRAAGAAAQAHRARPDRAGRARRGACPRGARDRDRLGHRAAARRRAARRSRGAARDGARVDPSLPRQDLPGNPRRADATRRPARSALDAKPAGARRGSRDATRPHALHQRRHQHAGSPRPVRADHAALDAARLRGQGAVGRPALPDGGGAGPPRDDRRGEPG